jgi:hypothetical protein
MRATSALVYVSPVFGFLTVSKWCSSLPDMPMDSSVSPMDRPLLKLSSNHTSGGSPSPWRWLSTSHSRGSRSCPCGGWSRRSVSRHRPSPHRSPGRSTCVRPDGGRSQGKAQTSGLRATFLPSNVSAIRIVQDTMRSLRNFYTTQPVADRPILVSLFHVILDVYKGLADRHHYHVAPRYSTGRYDSLEGRQYC